MGPTDKIKSDAIAADGRKRRLLVVIASFGNKNLDFLKSIIRTYQGMLMQVDIVVVSNVPKDLGPEIKVVVGLPSNNPWSLPFAHKPIFAEKADAYDLFIYSEDDMMVTEKNIQAFLEITPHLEADEIAGYLRYELNPTGTWSLPEVHGTHHWKPDSVRQRATYLTAEFSNEHAAFYILTQSQLKRAIASGGFLRPPYAGRYDMLCSAATDPYTSCGFRKVICISALNDFLVHHLPNRYAGQFGISLPDLQEQIQTLRSIGNREHPPTSLGVGSSKLAGGKWSKGYYESADTAVLSLVPPGAKNILSIGSGGGSMEAALKQRGADVTALPLDSVIGASAARGGINVVHGNLAEGFQQLAGQKFDCVLITNLLHLFPEPARVIKKCAAIIQKDGTLLIAGPNFDRLPVLIKRNLGLGEYGKLRNYDSSGISAFNVAQLSRWIHQAGLRPGKPIWVAAKHDDPVSGAHGSWQVLRRKLRRKLSHNRGFRFNAESWLLASNKEL